MALIYKAVLTPSKLSLLTAWLPSRLWFTGEAELRQMGAYRFDDPAGEVGLEALIVQGGDGSVFHVPLTYRGMPLPGAEEFLVGTAEHSVLGPRWVYDGCADPVWAAALAATVLTGGTQVEEFIDVDGRLEPRAPTATVWGSGIAGTPVDPIDAVSCHDEGPTTVVRSERLELVVVRVVDADPWGEHNLTGSWADGGPAVLASVRAV
ncbi:MAG TPA: hypothetical protein VFR23_17270 [Jiangellaceae bacterium]|nr:hypothetical protein [Jiangellaceae bacterium]